MKKFCIDCKKEITKQAVRCGVCHMKTNHNRKYWSEYFTVNTRSLL